MKTTFIKNWLGTSLMVAIIATALLALIQHLFGATVIGYMLIVGMIIAVIVGGVGVPLYQIITNKNGDRKFGIGSLIIFAGLVACMLIAFSQQP